MTDPLKQPAPEPAGGPIGKPRSVGLTILVAIVTFGIWTWVWSYMNGEELRNYRSQGLGGVAYLLFTILIVPVTSACSRQRPSSASMCFGFSDLAVIPR